MLSLTLEQLAKDAFDALAWRLDAREHARLAAASDLEKVQYRYRHVDSALFARTVADITGWPLVAIAPHDEPIHYATVMPGVPDGQLVDVTGIVCAAPPPPRDDSAPAPDVPLHMGEDDARLAVLRLLAQLNCPPFSSVAFQRQLLAFCAAHGIPDRHMPRRVNYIEMDEAASTNHAVTASRFLAYALADQAAGVSMAGFSGHDLPSPSWLHRCGVRAASQDNAGFVRALLDAADVPLLLDDDRRSWLHVAVSHGALATVALLLEHPRSAHLVRMASHGSGWTPLHSAAYHSNTAMASALIAAGADVDARLPQPGETPLHCCVSVRHSHGTEAAQIDMATLLLAHGADPLLCDADGASALHHAAGAGLTGVVQLLVQHGVPVEHAWPEENSDPPIFVAVATDRVEMIDALRALGAHTAGHSKAGDNLLTHCIRYCVDHARAPMVQHLLDVVGLDPDQPNLHGDTPDALAADMPEVRQVLNAFRARRAMALALAMADNGASRPAAPPR